MSKIRNKIEDWFSGLAIAIYDNKLKTLVFMFFFVAVFVSQIPKISVNTSTEGFLHENDPALEIYERFRDQFGRDEMVIVALKPENVFDLDFLSKLKTLHHDLRKNVPFFEDITSLINARNTRGNADELIVEDLIESFPTTETELQTIKNRALSNVMYENMLLSEDGKFTTIIIQTKSYSEEGADENELNDFEDADFEDDDFSEDLVEPEIEGNTTQRKYLTDAENSMVIRAVEKIVAKYDFENTEIYIAGSPVITDFLKRTMLGDMKKFVKIAVITIAIFLFVMFRRISGIFMPLLVVVLSLLSTVGLMAATGAQLKLPTQILPSFLLAVGVGDSVHVLVIFFHHFNKYGNKRDAISHALSHSGLAILMTSLTTSAGLLSFSTAAIAPIADLGIFSAAGVILALIYTIILLPALLAIVPLKPKQMKSESDSHSSLSDKILLGIADISIKRPYLVLVLSAIVIMVSITGALKIQVGHNPMKWLPENNPGRLSTEKIDLELKGSTSLEIIVDTKKENGIYDPDILNKLEESTEIYGKYKTDKVYAGKAWTITTVLKETNQALHENNESFYRVPQDKDLIAQEFFLFENSGSEDLEDFTDSRFTKARFTIKAPFLDAIAYTDFIASVENHFTQTFPEAEIEITGMVSLFTRVISSAIRSMQQSYVYAIIVITILMILLIGKLRIGLLSMIPNITPIIITLGIMGWANITMDLFCMLVGSIAIGLAVDDTIHFMHNFRRYFEETGDPEYAIKETLLTAGRAMCVTTLVLSIGFFTFMFASMNNLFYFGLLTGLTITMALLSDFLVAPALMIVANRKKVTTTIKQNESI